MKSLQHKLEAAILLVIFTIFKYLPLDTASFLGGFIARTFGPLFSVQRIARKNLAHAFPEKTDAEREKIISDMWDNLGRVAGELPHLPGTDLLARATIHGGEHMPAPGSAALFFSGHLANWELLPSVPHGHGVRIMLIYRHVNNPYVDKKLAAMRARHVVDMIAKGPRGAFKLAKSLKRKDSICMLIDQKMNDGIAVPLFGRDAMTAPAIAQLSLRYNLPIIPARVVRKNGAHFDIHVYPPLTHTPTGDSEKDTLAIMTSINAILESWIRETPGQWFWVHNRWPR